MKTNFSSISALALLLVCFTASLFGSGDLVPRDSEPPTISKNEVRKKIRFLYTHPKVRAGLVDALRKHPKVSLDFFFSYEGNDAKGLKKANKAFAVMLAKPMADLLETAGEPSPKGKLAYVKGLSELLGSPIYTNSFATIASANQEDNKEKCDILKRTMDMKRTRALEAHAAWLACALDNGTESGACDLLWTMYSEAGNEWQRAVTDYIAAGCAN